jgi:putative DNA primase/helicase
MIDEKIEQISKRRDLLDQQIQQLQKQLPFPDVMASGKPKGTRKNFDLVLHTYNIKICHNEMTKETEIYIPNVDFHNDTAMNAKIAYVYDLCVRHDVPTKQVEGLITMIANENSYHPVRDWIDSHTWDGVDRLNDFYDTIEIIDDDENSRKLKEIMMRKWVLSGVAALYHPGFSLEGVLTFSGAQGQGKTTWGYSLFPREYCMKWVKDAVVLDFKNKDSVMKALGYWLVELGELDATIKKAEIENLKGFITEKEDVIRPPYERKANKYSRRTFMYATVNSLEFLNDEENRRFWVLHVNKINQVKFDIAQFWAQIKHWYFSIKDLIVTPEDRLANDEYGWFLSSNERKLLTEKQQIHKVTDPIVQKLEVHVKPINQTDENKAQRLNATQILEKIGYLNVTQWQAKKCGIWLREQGFKQETSNKVYLVEIVSEFDKNMEEKVIELKNKRLKGMNSTINLFK